MTITEKFACAARLRNVWVCLCIFLLAVGVRFLVWQNNKADIENLMSGVTQGYLVDTKSLLSNDIEKFLAGADPPVDADVLAHPPGYPLLIAAVYALFGENDPVFRATQLLLNSISPVLVFLIGASLFDFRVGVIAGLLAAVSPQAAYYSSVILPDQLSVLPILLAIYLLAQAVRNKKISLVIFCGISIGLSCWLRSNALLLPLFFAGVVLVLFPKESRLKMSLVLLASFVLTISPITIRNYFVFQTFIPLSLGSGTTLIEGLGDAGFDLPSTDEGVMEFDARRFERPYYYGNLYSPDGIEREKDRIKVGLSVIKASPGWFLASVLQRGFTTFRMERVPVIATQQEAKDGINPIIYYLNLPLRLFQKIFITAVFFPLFLFGTILLLQTKEQRFKFAILAVVPIYYASVQPLLHTEYRYLLPASHALLIVSSVSLSALVGWIQKIKLSNI